MALTVSVTSFGSPVDAMDQFSPISVLEKIAGSAVELVTVFLAHDATIDLDAAATEYHAAIPDIP